MNSTAGTGPEENKEEQSQTVQKKPAPRNIESKCHKPKVTQTTSPRPIAKKPRPNIPQSPEEQSVIEEAIAIWQLQQTEATPTSSEIRRISQAAHERKRYRFDFFNSKDGTSLRLSCPMHFPRATGKSNWCSLCGSFKTGWRGHKSSVRCLLCHVHLCIQTHAHSKSCWDVWHSSRSIQPRIFLQPHCPKQTKQKEGVGDSDVAAESQDEGSQ